MEDLEAELGGGVLSVAAECGGEIFLYHPDRVLPTASSIKIAIVPTTKSTFARTGIQM